MHTPHRSIEQAKRVAEQSSARSAIGQAVPPAFVARRLTLGKLRRMCMMARKIVEERDSLAVRPTNHVCSVSIICFINIYHIDSTWVLWEYASRLTPWPI